MNLKFSFLSIFIGGALGTSSVNAAITVDRMFGEANDWAMSGQGGIHQLPSRTFTGRNEGELLLGVAEDVALRQRLLQFINLSLGEVGVVFEIQMR